MSEVSSSPPLVLVTAPVVHHDSADWVRLRRTYLDALTRVGLVPLVSPPLPDPTIAAAVLARMSGLVLTGGEDVAPTSYGAAPHPALGPTSPERDRWEIALVQAAERVHCPTLAICRGAQLVNVALGGTLMQDIPSERPSVVPHHPPGARNVRTHTVQLDATSRLARLTGAITMHVNSMHHQAVATVAPSLRVTGHASDGLIESVEPRDEHWWMVAVQWHPEELEGTAESWDRDLFVAFAGAVSHGAPFRKVAR
jgi:putative glutamine amidotransferase